MEDFTRKFNAAQDKAVQIHHVLTTVYEALKEKGYAPSQDRFLELVGMVHD